MRGVLHGACDYLVKPIRMEKLQIIWQHVIRKSMNIKRNQIALDSTMIAKNSNQNSNQSIKRKDHRGNDDAAAQMKKPRVVWSNDLHHKFVDAVNHLGIDSKFFIFTAFNLSTVDYLFVPRKFISVILFAEAVPRNILHLMNVENLTNQNVASHLQVFFSSLMIHINVAK